MGNIFSINVARHEKRVLLLGLEGAGKTTILHKLGGELSETIAFIGCSVQTCTVNGTKTSYISWDVGGNVHDQMRHMLYSYYPNTHGLIFVIDPTDRDRLDAARDEMHHVLKRDDFAQVTEL